MKNFKTSGVCAKEINFSIDSGVIKKVSFMGGCNGNLKGMGLLLEGMKVEDVKTGAGRWSGTFAAHASAGWVIWAVTCRQSLGCWTPAALRWAISKPLAARWRR